jgi:pimeloyl-ACP methyl ester carboxylesterase
VLEARIEPAPGGQRLRLARLGSGPPLVLLHGYPDNLQIWSALAPRLAARFTVVAMDWPGMGRSEAWPGGATPLHMAERLRALLDHWGLGRVTLLGMDMGGQPALAFAGQHPERTERIVVMNSLVLGDEPTSWEIALLRRFGWNRFLLRRLPGVVFRRAMSTSLPRGERLPADLRADLWDTFRRPEVRAFVSKMCAGYQGTLPKLPALYAQIACPVLALWGERDRHFPPSQGAKLRTLLRDARLEVLPGAEHWMVWHRAADVARAVEAFLQSPG